MKKASILLIISLPLLFIMQSIEANGQSQSFPLGQFKKLIKQRIKWTGARDTISSRVPKGESCVEAATDRAIEVTYIIKTMQARGQFGNYGAKVGTRSGWNIGIGSIHTYTVVEIVDVHGKIVHTLDIDNYMGPIYISNHSSINWNSNYVNVVQDISSWNPTNYIAKTKKLIKSKAKTESVAAEKTTNGSQKSDKIFAKAARIKIGKGETATKSFAFGSAHVNRTVNVSFLARTFGTWDTDGEDNLIVKVNGQTVLKSPEKGTKSSSINVKLDRSGGVVLLFQADVTGDDEGLYIDNLLVSGEDFDDK